MELSALSAIQRRGPGALIQSGSLQIRRKIEEEGGRCVLDGRNQRITRISGDGRNGREEWSGKTKDGVEIKQGESRIMERKGRLKSQGEETEKTRPASGVTGNGRQIMGG